MPVSKTAPLWVSLNDIESTALKAARSAGYGWGLAEEVGRSARWLAMRGLPWLKPLTEGVLKQMHRLESFDSAARVGSTFGPSAPQRRLGPISVAVSLADEVIPLPPAGAELSWRTIAAPVLILPALARLSRRFDRPILVRWPGTAIDCRNGEMLLDENARPGLSATSAEWLTVTRDLGPAEVRGASSSLRHQGEDVNPVQWRELLAFAEQKFVPESETTRMPGAGSGNGDID
jgi:hypothetical protein